MKCVLCLDKLFTKCTVSIFISRQGVKFYKIYLLQFLNNNVSRSYLCPLDLLLPKLNYLAFQSFDEERHLVRVIPETCRAH